MGQLLTMYIARLSNELLSLAVSEFFSIMEAEGAAYKVFKRIDEFLLFTSNDELIELLASRSALLTELGKVLDIAAEDDNLYSVVMSYIDGSRNGHTCVDVDSIRGFGRKRASDLQMLLSTMGIRWRGCKSRIRIALVAGLAIIYEVLYRRREAKFHDREPHRRPCYRPGTMKPTLARTLVNIAKVSSRKRSHLLDPFCGVGGIALEACNMGLQVTCADIDGKMVECARVNGAAYGCKNTMEFIEADSLYSIFRGRFFDAVVTDPPYGIQSTPRSQSLSSLMEGFIRNSYEVVKRGGHMVFAIPMHLEDHTDSVIDSLGASILEKHLNRVHGSLTRVIYVVKVL
ncbi:MAG: methyltransferase [Ignisphaera sp.]|nr:methyltransferase [Ignisphaera sp.]MDW8085548.1 methyltransferase [Ignisphaera sp.]